MDTEDFGPLPQSDRADRLQQESLAVLRASTPTDLYLMRDERVDDKGVDGSLELKKAGYFTNLRLQFQLKATEHATPNADDSISYPIAVSTLNYLLNSTSPLAILYVHPSRELRFAWIRDVAERLTREKPGWLKQETVTIRFRQKLTVDQWVTIHERALREGRLIRSIQENLASAAAVSSVHVRIDTSNLETVTAEQARNWLVSSGLALISEGKLAHVDGMLTIALPTFPADWKLHLVSGYMNYSRGDFLSATAHLAKASAYRNSDDTVDSYFLKHLRLICDFNCGRLSADALSNLQASITSTAPEIIALQLRFDAARRAHQSELLDRQRRGQLFAELVRLAEKIEVHPDASLSMKSGVTLARLYADGADANSQFIESVFAYHIQSQAGLLDATDIRQRLVSAFGRIAAIYQGIQKLIAEARSSDNPLLIAEGLLTQVTLLSIKWSLAQVTIVRRGGTLAKVPAEMDALVLASIDECLQISRTIRSIEKEVRAKMLLADWHEYAGRQKEAIEVACDAVGMASAMGYEQIAGCLNSHIQSRTPFRELLARAKHEPDFNQIAAESSDEELRRFSRDWVEFMRVPEDRLPIVEKDAFCMRRVALEKRHWCQFLEVEQRLEHFQSRSTVYLRDPERSCVCRKHRIRSRIEDPDWDVVINAFKRVHCEDCNDRSPQEPSQNDNQ